IMIEVVRKLIEGVRAGQIEIYNEFSLQHEIGILLRSRFPEQKVQFERNVSYFFQSGNFTKKEIDIAVFSPDKKTLSYSIELKFPRNGQYPEQMFSFCKDILFIEQLKKSGFKKAFLIIFADDPLFYSGKGNGIYGYFRQKKKLSSLVQKPTGGRDETIRLSGSYVIEWVPVSGALKYTLIEAMNG
ncbi:MAG: hypothetical protein ACPL1K_07165, partial [Candidatus Kryptoniota bacterium]